MARGGRVQSGRRHYGHRPRTGSARRAVRPVRATWVEIDLGAVAHNVAVIAAAVAPAALCAVVKADAYGHGDVPVATTALAAGASTLAVALVEEGVRLREAGITAPILLLSEPDPGDAAELATW
ncbi:MAG: alanine racemase, partial [Acidimicrobiia bacterium]|nr:alanine racemase [Acidimicrobiia bacterium]